MISKPLFVLAACLLTASSEAGDDLHYDQQQAIRKQQLLDLGEQTHLCMHDAVQAELQNGVRSRPAIDAFVEPTCGKQLSDFLVSIGRSKEDALSLIHLMAEREITEAVQ